MPAPSVYSTPDSGIPSALQRLHQVMSALAAAHTREEISGIFVTEACAALGASACVLYFAEGDGLLSLGAARGVDPERGGLGVLPLDAPLPLARSVRTGQALWYETAEAMLADYPALAPITIAREALQAVVAAPLRAHGRTVGGLALSFERARPFGAEERSFVLTLAEHVALAVDRAALFERERRAHADAQQTQMEAQRAQTLESLGVLAGGVAHHFNNLLSIVVGHVEMAGMLVEEGGPAHEHLRKAEEAALRSREVTQQLLALSRGGSPVRRVSSLGTTAKEAVGVMSCGPDVTVRVRAAEDLWLAEVDLRQIEQLLQNLVQNAIEAMPGGGAVEVVLENERLDRPEGLPLAPGPYVRIDVVDQGVGIPPGLRSRIFDPFFTTRPDARGLGLTTASAIARRHGGHIAALPEPGGGSRFVVRLPAIPGAARKPVAPVLVSGPEGPLRILVMDDEAGVRDALSSLLRSLGHAPVAVSGGAAAVTAWQEARAEGRPFDLSILDLTVPGGLGGVATLARIREADPSAVAIVSSGYSEDPVLADPGRAGFAAVLPKPYTRLDLQRALALSARRTGP